MKNNLSFKIMTMLFCIAFTAVTLSKFATLIQQLIKIKYNWQFELFMVIGMLFFQFPFIFKKKISQKAVYYYNMLLVSLLGALLLWPLLALNRFYKMADIINIAYFFAVVFIMFF